MITLSPFLKIWQCIQSFLAVTAILVSTPCSFACQKATTPKTETAAKVASAQHNDIKTIGGIILTIRVLPSRSNLGEEIPVTSEQVSLAIKVLKKRITRIGFRAINISPLGQDLITLELINISKSKLLKVKKNIQTLGLLEFKTVYPGSLILADQVAADPQNEIVPGYELKVLTDTDDDGNTTSENLLISRRAALNNSYVIKAQELHGAFEGMITIELSKEGGDRMFRLTKSMDHGRDRLAIVLDGIIHSAPVVQSALSSKFQISGMADASEAKNLAAILQNPLTNSLHIEDERVISPSSSK